jgi:hypothetical protein
MNEPGWFVIGTIILVMLSEFCERRKHDTGRVSIWKSMRDDLKGT